MILVDHVISQDHVTLEPRDFMRWSRQCKTQPCQA